jgi:hypothetical protein
MVRAAAPARPGASREVLAALRLRTGVSGPLRDDLLPVTPPFVDLLGSPGLRRGTTVVIDGGRAPGATSLLLGLLAGPSGRGAWCAVVAAPDLGLVAAGELGVDLERLVLVPEPGRRLVPAVGALLDGFDLVCVRLGERISSSDARRVVARVRERRAVLVVVTGRAVAPAGSRAVAPTGSTAIWPEVPDVRLEVLSGCFTGIGTAAGDAGAGRITAHLVDVAAHRRRAVPAELVRRLQLPGEEGISTSSASEGPGLDAPGLDAPGLDAPGLDAPGLDATGTS